MKRVVAMGDALAQTDLPVLLVGETGTGKGLLARRIHERSPRRNRPMVDLDCAAIMPELFESEVFGHERGSFTGAITDRKGKLQLASDGTLFMDEVNSLPLSQQVKFLKALEDGELMPVGGSKSVAINLRIVAATSTDLQKMVARGEFREDLYHRIGIAIVQIPSLRERVCEIPHLTKFFLERCDAGDFVVDQDALEYLSTRHWPGNLRQLRNVVLQGALRASMENRKNLQLADVQIADTTLGGNGKPTERGVWVGYGRTIQGATNMVINMTLEACGGNVRKAAQILDVNFRTIYKWRRERTAQAGE